MLFHMPQKNVIPPNLQINETNIEFVDNFIFLGLSINKHLHWKNHVIHVTNKIARTIGMINTLKKKKNTTIKYITNTVQLFSITAS